MNSAPHRTTAHRRTGDWSAVIVNYNGDPFLPACLEAISKVRLGPSQVFVVDNASTDGSLFELNAYPWAEAIQNRTNLGFAGAANIGLERIETSLAVILNPDVELAPDYGDALIEVFVANPRLGVAGTLLTYPDGETVQHAGGGVHYPLLDTDHRGRGQPLSAELERQVDIDFATGAALAVRMEAVRAVDGFDEQFVPVYYEDVDLSTRIRANGWDVRLCPTLRALHHEGVTLQHDPPYYIFLQRNRLRYALKHLSPRQWSEAFVPAEMARIRHELAKPSIPGVGETIGIEGIDVLLRDLDPLASADRALLAVPEYPYADVDLAELHELRYVAGKPLASRTPFVARLRGWLNSLTSRWYVDGALAEQRAFNDAVVRAFTAQNQRNASQDRLNREQTAALILVALVTLRRVHDLARARANEGGDS